jgi:GxxExxY protein
MRGAYLKHGELTRRVIGVFFAVYNELGPGFLESVYEHAMEIALKEAGIVATRQLPLQVHFRGHVVGEFRADMVVESTLVLELKAMRAIAAEHESQMLNYLRATDFEIGLIMNFGPKPEFRRMLFDNQRKLLREMPRPGESPDHSDLCDP